MRTNRTILPLLTILAISFSASAAPAKPAAKPAVLPPVYVVPNFHPASCGWLTDWSTERNYCANSYLAHLDRVKNDPNYSFAISEVNNMIAIGNFQPQRLEELKARIKEGRVEPVNAFFLEPTVSLSGGEALIKMGIEGLRWQEAVLGYRPRFCWAIDTCGVHEQMPQICVGLGLEGLVYNRCNKTGSTLYWSVSPDGSRVLTLSPGGYSQLGTLFGAKAPLTDKELSSIRGEIGGRVSSTPAGAPILLLGGKGDYALPPARQENPSEFLAAWAKANPQTPVQFTTLSKYFDAVRPLAESGKIKVTVKEGGTGYTFDAFWIQMPQFKAMYRSNEHALQGAETMATLSSLTGKYVYPSQAFRQAWLLMLLNMDRNTLWGAAGGMVFEHPKSWDAKDRSQWVDRTSDAILAAAGSSLLSAGDSDGCALFNPANWKRHDPFLLEGHHPGDLPGAVSQELPDHRTLVEMELPSLGTVGYHPSQEPVNVSKKIDLPAAIETDYYVAKVDPASGELVSLATKPGGKELLGGPGNVLMADKNTHKEPGDFAPDASKRQRLGRSDPQAALAAWSGPLATVVEVSGKFYGGATCKRVLRFYKHSPRIDLETTLVDVPDRTMVTAQFPLAGPVQEIRRGIPGGFTHGAWDKPNETLHGWTKGITPAVRWSHYQLEGAGLAILDRGASGREITGNTPMIFLYNASDKYYGYANAWLSGKGSHTIEYALVVHEGDFDKARIPQAAWEYNGPPQLVPTCRDGSPKSFVTTSDNVILEVMRREGDQIELRLIECHNQAGTAQVTVNLPHKGAAMTDLLGGHPKEISGGPTYTFPVRPQQIVTLRLGAAGAVAPLTTVMAWDDMVPENKKEALHKYIPGVVGHPPKGY